MDLSGSSRVAFLPNLSRCGRYKKRTGEPRIWFRFIRTLFISITTIARDDESLLRSPCRILDIYPHRALALIPLIFIF